MRNNSLRQQLIWQNKQQTYLFKKITKNNYDDSPSPSTNPLTVKHYNEQHSELQWLDKIGDEVKAYRKDIQKQQTNIGDSLRKRKLEEIDDKHNGNERKQKIEFGSKQGKIEKENERKAVSQKKNKNQTSGNKQNKMPTSFVKLGSVKYQSYQKNKPKSNKKIQFSSAKSSAKGQSIDKAQKVNYSETPSNKKIDCEQLNTDNYGLMRDSQLFLNQPMESLWKRESRIIGYPEASEQLKQILLDKKYDKKIEHKKSIGKIVRNVQKINQTNIQINVTVKPKPEPVIITNVSPSELNIRQVEKVMQVDATKLKTNNIDNQFIKLQTDKLSQYLVESKATLTKNCSNIATDQYQKYCLSKRLLIKEKQCSQPTQTSQLRFKYEETDQERSTSQQRKLNKFVQMIKPKKIYDGYVRMNRSQHLNQSHKDNCMNRAEEIRPTIKPTDIKIDASSEIKLKRVYQYKNELNQNKNTNQVKKQDQVKNNYLNQKLYTLHSESSQNEQSQISTPKIPQPNSKLQPVFNYKHHKIQQTITIPSSPYQPKSTATASQLKSIDMEVKTDKHKKEDQPIIKYKQPSSTHIYQSDSPDISNDHGEELTILFNFLDEAKRGFLTDTNCCADNLTEELKIMFSFILNQIRSKKRFFSLDKFIEQSRQMLKVKDEVYSANFQKNGRGGVCQMLRQNIQLLKKRSPLQFVKHTTTESIYDTSLTSKRTSINSNQSIVISKVKIQSINQKYVNVTSPMKQTVKVQDEQPEIVLIKKYGLRKNRVIQSVQPDRNNTSAGY